MWYAGTTVYVPSSRGFCMSANFWEGKGIRLRAIEPSDWEIVFEWDQDSDAAIQSYYLPFPQSKEATKQWAEKTSTQPTEKDRFFFVIETLSGEIAGSISTHSCEPRNGTFKYGLAIREEHRKKGYASEAIRILLRYFFGELRYQKVTANVYGFNKASIHLHERLGFQLEGRVRRMIYTQGRYFDELLFGMTAEEAQELDKGQQPC